MLDNIHAAPMSKGCGSLKNDINKRDYCYFQMYKMHRTRTVREDHLTFSLM